MVWGIWGGGSPGTRRDGCRERVLQLRVGDGMCRCGHPPRRFRRTARTPLLTDSKRALWVTHRDLAPKRLRKVPLRHRSWALTAPWAPAVVWITPPCSSSSCSSCSKCSSSKGTPSMAGMDAFGMGAGVGLGGMPGGMPVQTPEMAQLLAANLGGGLGRRGLRREWSTAIHG